MAGDFWIVPEDVRALPEILSGLGCRWWIAGGWAIDLAFGRATRRHEDVEIAVLFEDQERLRDALSSWELCVPTGGRLEPWQKGEMLSLPDRNQLWARRTAQSPWSLEILFEARDGDDWVYRRDQRVRRPLAQFGSEADGLPIVRPEVQLLFKSKEPRDKDTHDFHNGRALLGDEDAQWLRSALDVVNPTHPWLEHL